MHMVHGIGTEKITEQMNLLLPFKLFHYNLFAPSKLVTPSIQYINSGTFCRINGHDENIKVETDQTIESPCLEMSSDFNLNLTESLVVTIILKQWHKMLTK